MTTRWMVQWGNMRWKRKREKNIRVRGTKDYAKMTCSLHAFIDLITFLKTRIPSKSWDKIYCTPFGATVRCFVDGLVQSRNVTKQNIDFEATMKYYVEDGIFDFDGAPGELTAECCAALFGLENVGDSFATRKNLVDKIGRSTNFFPKVDAAAGPNRAQIKAQLEMELCKPAVPKPSEKGKEMVMTASELEEYKNCHLIASLVIMHLMSTAFFAKSETYLSWDLVNLCLTLDRLHTYNRVKSITNNLIAGLNEHKKIDPRHINECTILLQYWFLEFSRIRKPERGVMYQGRPWFVVWSINALFNRKDLSGNPNHVANLVAEGIMKGSDTSSIGGEESDDSTEAVTWVAISKNFELRLEELIGKVKQHVKTMATISRKSLKEVANQEKDACGQLLEELKSYTTNEIKECDVHIHMMAGKGVDISLSKRQANKTSDLQSSEARVRMSKELLKGSDGGDDSLKTLDAIGES